MKKELTILLMALLVCGYSKAQVESVETNHTMQMLSPDATTFTKYGDYSINLYTGTPNINVPLYEINEAGIRVPVSLNYDATGMQPNRDAGVAGQNWTLMAGGMITRQVRGTPDDCLEYYPYNSVDRFYMFDTEKYGYWAGIKQGYAPKSKDYLLNNINSYFKLQTTGGRQQWYCDIGFEHEPDIFTVSVNGNSFRFMLNNDGTVKVFGNKAIKVDLSNLSIQRYSSYPISSTITVTMENGYRYVFGGNVSNLEIYYPTIEPPTTSANYYAIRTQRGIINAWYLTKIITPEGQNITFTYKPMADSYKGRWEYGMDNVFAKKNISQIQKIETNSETAKAMAILTAIKIVDDTFTDNDMCTGLISIYNLSSVKVVYLDSIITPLSTIKFHYTSTTHKFYGDLDNHIPTLKKFQTDFPIKNYKLDSITVKDKNNSLISNAKFTYKVVNNNNTESKFSNSSRLFLDAVCINKKQNYAFQYNTALLPEPLTQYLDMQGFYNGRTSVFVSTSLDPLQPNLSHRQANPNYASIGLLKQITYPTGGYTKFEFECNNYGKRVEHNGNIDMEDLYDLNDNLYAGGARIKKIIQSTGDTTIYSYTNNRQMKNLVYQSSGIYVQPYIHELEYTSKLPSGSNIYYYNTTAGEKAMYRSSAVSEFAVGYTQVTEIQRNNGRNNGKTVYNFSNHETNPDILFANCVVIKTDNIVSSKSSFTQQMNKFIIYSDNALARGQLLSKEYYNEVGTLLQKETYKYNDSPNRFQEGVIGVNVDFTDGYGAGGVANTYASYYYPTELTEKQVRTYTGNNSIVETTNYTYNSKQQPSEITTANSDSKTLKTTYNYAWETNTDMLNNYILSPLGTQTNYVANSVVKVQKNEYRLENNFPVLSKVYSGRNTSALETEVNYSKYNKYNKPEYIISKANDDHIVYLWSYKGQYPIAEIKNATYDQVKNAFNDENLINRVADAIKPAGSDLARINNLRNTLPNTFVTTYTYKPLVGITKATDPRGISTYYEYDSVGRLKTTYIGEKDENGNETKRVLKAYDYHYANQ